MSNRQIAQKYMSWIRENKDHYNKCVKFWKQRPDSRFEPKRRLGNMTGIYDLFDLDTSDEDMENRTEETRIKRDGE